LEIPDLTACEREPIHSPGAIEPNGAMLVVGEDTLTVLQASSNILRFLKVAPEALLGMHLTGLFPPDVVHQFVSGIKADGDRHYVVGLLAKSGAFLEALAHRQKGLLILEFEPGSSPIPPGPDVFESLTTAIAELGRPPLPDGLLPARCRADPERLSSTPTVDQSARAG
jgi:light-regulated signal transduction histidine kinase (bacteriophytochrome)